MPGPTVIYPSIENSDGKVVSPGTSNTFEIGTVTTLDPDQSATVSLAGTPPEYRLNFGLPRGQTGGADPETLQARDDAEAAAIAASAAAATITARVLPAASRTAMKNAGRALGDVVYLTEAGRKGVFVLRAGDYATRVSADTLEGIYIADAAIATTTGAWVREWEGEIYPEWWGADPTETVNSAPAWNAAVAFALDQFVLYNAGPVTVKLSGRYLMSDSLNVFYFKSPYTSYPFISINIEGTSDGYIPGKQVGFTFTRTDRPGILTAANRRTRFANFMINGPGANTNPSYANLITDTGSTPWWNPAGTLVDSRYSVTAGIAIDPFTTSLPADGGYSGYNGSSGSLNHYTSVAFSSNVVLENVGIQGWIVGIALSTNGAGQQCDHIIIKNADLSYNKIGIAVGQDQCRGIVVENPFAIGLATFVDCRSYGSLTGVMPSVIGGVLVFIKNLINAAGDRGRASISNLYAESMFSLGYWGSGGSPLDISSCTLTFIDDVGASIDVHLANDGPVNFFGGVVEKYQGVPNKLRFYNASALTFDGVTFDAVPQFAFVDNVDIRNCRLRYENGGAIYGIISESSGTNAGFGDSTYDVYMAPGGVFRSTAQDRYRNWWNHEGFLNELIETATITFDGAGAGSFTAANTGAYKVGDAYCTRTPTTIKLGPDTRTVSSPMVSIGRVTSIVGSTVNLVDCPRSLATGSFTIYTFRLGTYRDRSIGDTTSGSNSITNVTNPATWGVGKYIRGAGIPVGTYITAKSGTTLTISRNATATATGVNLYDALLTLEGGQDAATGAPASGTWFKGDYLAARGVSATQPDANNMIIAGYVCTVSGSPGTWCTVYHSTVTPAT
jgi:hypothetical protein